MPSGRGCSSRNLFHSASCSWRYDSPDGLRPLAPLGKALLKAGIAARNDTPRARVDSLQANGADLEWHAHAGLAELSSYARGPQVTVDRPEGPPHGGTAGLDANGFLLVRDGDGRVVTVLAGGVRPARI